MGPRSECLSVHLPNLTQRYLHFPRATGRIQMPDVTRASEPPLTVPNLTSDIAESGGTSDDLHEPTLVLCFVSCSNVPENDGMTHGI